jgi:hypothetical protein
MTFGTRLRVIQRKQVRRALHEEVYSCFIFIWKPTDILVNSNETFQGKASLSKSEVAEDVSFFLYVMKNGYGGRKYVPKNKFEKAMKNIKGIGGPLASEDLKNKIDRFLLEIPDNHLKARLNGDSSPERKVGVNRNHTPKIWEVKTEKIKSKKLLYISIKKFPSHKDRVWKGFIESVKSKVNLTDMAIIDLRGNGGGDDTKGMELSEVFFGGVSGDPIEKQYISQTPETLAIFSNLYQVRSLKLANKGEAVPPYFNELKNEILKEFDIASIGNMPTEKIKGVNLEKSKFNSKKGYAKPIYILMDGKCASSCESTIDSFEYHPHVKKVGENTGGYIHFGDIGYFLLPNSKIEVQCPTKYNHYGDGRFIEVVGISPDLTVPNGQDAYTFVIKNMVW